MKKLINRINKSPINYFSDLIIIAMVLFWIIGAVIMLIMGIYSTVVLEDTAMWSDVATLIGIPLSCGGALWMIKNSVQHAIANANGEQCKEDFPAVGAEGEWDGNEKKFGEDMEEETDDEHLTEEEYG